MSELHAWNMKTPVRRETKMARRIHSTNMSAPDNNKIKKSSSTERLEALVIISEIQERKSIGDFWRLFLEPKTYVTFANYDRVSC